MRETKMSNISLLFAERLNLPFWLRKEKKVSIEKKTGTSEGCDAYILYYSAKYNYTNNK